MGGFSCSLHSLSIPLHIAIIFSLQQNEGMTEFGADTKAEIKTSPEQIQREYKESTLALLDGFSPLIDFAMRVSSANSVEELLASNGRLKDAQHHLASVGLSVDSLQDNFARLKSSVSDITGQDSHFKDVLVIRRFLRSRLSQDTQRPGEKTSSLDMQQGATDPSQEQLLNKLSGFSEEELEDYLNDKVIRLVFFLFRFAAAVKDNILEPLDRSKEVDFKNKLREIFDKTKPADIDEFRYQKKLRTTVAKLKKRLLKPKWLVNSSLMKSRKADSEGLTALKQTYNFLKRGLAEAESIIDLYAGFDFLSFFQEMSSLLKDFAAVVQPAAESCREPLESTIDAFVSPQVRSGGVYLENLRPGELYRIQASISSLVSRLAQFDEAQEVKDAILEMQKTMESFLEDLRAGKDVKSYYSVPPKPVLDADVPSSLGS